MKKENIKMGIFLSAPEGCLWFRVLDSGFRVVYPWDLEEMSA